MNESRYHICESSHGLGSSMFRILWQPDPSELGVYYTFRGMDILGKLKRGSTPEDLGLEPDTNQEPDK